MAGISEESIKTLREQLRTTVYQVFFEGAEDTVTDTVNDSEKSEKIEKRKRAVLYYLWKFDYFDIELPKCRSTVKDIEKNRIPPDASDEFAEFETIINASEVSTNSCNREHDSPGEKKDLHETERNEDLITPKVATNDETTDTHKDDRDDFAYKIGLNRIAFFIGVGEFEKRGDDGENDETRRFDNNLKRTSELRMDRDKMERALKKLGFQFKCNQGCYTTEIRKFISDVLDCNEKCDIIVVVISSHGEEATEINRDTQSKTTRHRFLTKDSYIYTDDLIEMFNTTKLKEIPKLFFIQACRSGLHTKTKDIKDEGVEINVLEQVKNTTREIISGRSDADGTNVQKHQDFVESPARGPKGKIMVKKEPEKSDTSIDTSIVESATGFSEEKSSSDILQQATSTSDVITTNTHKEPADDTAVRPFTCAPHCLVMYASAPGKIAYRRTGLGGWFISALSKDLLAWSDEKNKDQDLLQILTSVIREVSLYVAFEEEKDDYGKTTEHEFKSAACLTHMLIKDVYL